MEPLLPDLSDLIAERGARVVPLTPETALLAATLDWKHRDPFDRMIAATAIKLHAVLVSTDTAFDGLSAQGGWPDRVW